jgi:uncharacterized protein YbaR (Trm112 family)
MTTSFPTALIAAIGCPKDGYALALHPLAAAMAAIEEGTVACAQCAATYQIRNGILRMFSDESLDEESRREVKARDERALDIDPTTSPWWTNLDDEMEIGSTLKALNLEPHEMLLELGCGDGRFTVLLVPRCRALAALDFSIQSLRALQQRLAVGTRIGPMSPRSMWSRTRLTRCFQHWYPICRRRRIVGPCTHSRQGRSS